MMHFNGHMQTILPAKLRKVEGVNYTPQRLELNDGDFLDLSWSKIGSDKLLIITHGLEGGSDRHYCHGLVKIFNEAGWDVLAWNYRSCSGTMNRLPRFYHSGDTGDIDRVVQHVVATYNYHNISLVGISMGGSVTLNYLGNKKHDIPSSIQAGVAISTPIHLSSSCDKLETFGSLIYNKNFMYDLNNKVRIKAKMLPGQIDASLIEKHNIKRLREFDEYYTAPLHGFKDANDYYEKASSLYQLENIKHPTLVINATNDPFLGTPSIPYDLLRNHKYVDLEAPNKGGHVGFCIAGEKETYTEKRSLTFLGKF
ncbi:alpha/beta fold hydrolase [Algivirga pacifica]|uniref:Alpha/beta fold hydrolase n=2 Tax=Algivirga pacifica TaxID=1162670 RepID=A0ABP9DCI8_9BACT